MRGLISATLRNSNWRHLAFRSAVSDAKEPVFEDVLYHEEADELLSSLTREVKPSTKASSSESSSGTDPSVEGRKRASSLPRAEIRMPEIPGESLESREIRSHNSSLYNIKGQVIIGEVKAVDKHEVVVDLGWKTYQTFLKKEISLSQIYTNSNSKKKRHLNEILPGDELHFRIEEVETPYGEMFVSTQNMRADIRRKLVWDELKLAFKDGHLVSGRPLNPCSGGYAIGVAGFVAFCPLTRISLEVERRIGVLSSFSILKISENVGEDFLVGDASVKEVGRPRRYH